MIEHIRSADVLVLIPSQVALGISAPLKNAVDWASRVKGLLQGKACGIVHAGEDLGVDMLRASAVFCNLLVDNFKKVAVRQDQFDSMTGLVGREGKRGGGTFAR